MRFRGRGEQKPQQSCSNCREQDIENAMFRLHLGHSELDGFKPSSSGEQRLQPSRFQPKPLVKLDGFKPSSFAVAYLCLEPAFRAGSLWRIEKHSRY
jgi:hypothetical protein